MTMSRIEKLALATYACVLLVLICSVIWATAASMAKVTQADINKKILSEEQTRFSTEPSKGIPFDLYRDKKTGRLYAYLGRGGLTEISEETLTEKNK